ncbi:MAG: phosphatidate cytidylyltransferase [Xanthomonadales bacterium]|nr:phosphatidate cytidylyltransferase [Xanthomonadales bacterium]
MLRTRVLTALVLAPLAFALIFLTSPDRFALILAVLLMVGAWEFRRLAALDGRIPGWFLLVIQAVLLLVLYQYRTAVIAHAAAWLTTACGVWLLMLLRLVMYRPGQPPDFHYRIVSFACALATLSFAWIALTRLAYLPSGAWWILLLFLVIWSADIGAYFAGRAWGKRKLAASVSPGKTVEGLFGGLAAAVLIALLANAVVPSLQAPALPLAIVAVITSLVSVGGDLFISLHKRSVGLKDTGAIFPGHGGLLDRLDSLLAGAPFFAAGAILLHP